MVTPLPRGVLLALALGLGACVAIVAAAHPQEDRTTLHAALVADADCSSSLDVDNDGDHHCGQAITIAIDAARNDDPRAFVPLNARAYRIVSNFLFVSRAPPVFAPTV